MKFDSTNTFLTVVSLAMFSITSVLVGLLVCVPDSGADQECDPQNTTDIQCSPGQYCGDYGMCLNIGNERDPEELRECKPGQRASECRCPASLEVRDEICDVPASTEVCEHAEVAALLTRLDQVCSGDRKTAPGRLIDCPPADLRDVVIGSHRDTLKIAESCREQSFTLHFSVGTPRAHQANNWPGRGPRAELRDLVKGMLEHVEPKGYLLMIALASPKGTHELNFELATRRSDATVALVTEARTSFPALDKRLTDITTIVGLVGHEERATLDIATFDRTWGATDRFHAWDAAHTRRMKTALAAWRDQTIADLELQWLTQVINQSVLVIPLPCELPTTRTHG